MTDGKLLSGQSLAPEQTLVSPGGRARLHYQSDGNLVVYLDGQPFWTSQTAGYGAGQLKMRADGNLVITDNNGNGVASTDTYGNSGAMVQLQDDGNFVIYCDPSGPQAGVAIWAASTGAFRIGPVTPEPVPVPTPGYVRLFEGYSRTYGRSFGDDSGPRIVHGCSWFPALVEAHWDWDRFYRQLVVIAQHQMYVRILWRLNGWKWTESGLTVDPLRDSWFDATLRRVLEACRDLGLRVNLASGDMNNCSWAQQQEMFTRVASIAASVDEQTVWLMGGVNEMRGTWAPGETDENVDRLRQLAQLTKTIYPWNHHAGSDPGDMAKAGMIRLAPSPCNAALVHTRPGGTIADFLRRTFNNQYENQPGLPIVEDEPSGPNGPPAGPDSQLVYQPIDRPADIFALYTMQVLAGSASTYFNDPALVSRQPLESTWGFRELPALWRQMGLPQDVGQGRLVHGGLHDAPVRIGTGAERCDSVICLGDRLAFAIISGGRDWRVPSGWDADVTVYSASGNQLQFRVSAGQTLLTSDGPHDPVVLRLDRR